ncbi:MAG: SEC-C metal-binding domain-containing protein [Candidatus Geothermincolia bacterium]
MPDPLHCFTRKADSLKRTLISKIIITQSLSGTSSGLTSKPFEYIAIWDTGATGSVVSETVVRDCGLLPTGVTKTSTTHGIADANTYVVDFQLPNGPTIQNVQVTEGQINGGDVLIGMDVITVGDFAVTNYGGRTAFTFRVPSVACIDFVDELNKKNKPSRNQACPCGSGKKYKLCCGQ